MKWTFEDAVNLAVSMFRNNEISFKDLDRKTSELWQEMELQNGDAKVKRCITCGCEIVNGVNGCTYLSDCFTCHGGYPRYAPPVKAEPTYTAEELDALEDRCLNDCTD